MIIHDDRDEFEKAYKWNYPNAELNYDSVTQGYYDPTEQRCYTMWLLSSNRDGYKLVPVNPSYEQLDKLKTCCVALQRADLSDLEAHGAYRVVIGVSNNDSQ